MTRLKVKSRSHLDVAHIHSSTSVPTKHYKLPTSYDFQDFKGRGHYGKASDQIMVTHHYSEHLHPLINVPAKNQIPIHDGF